MDKIIIHGRKIVGGCVEGEALVTKEELSGFGGMEKTTGRIIDRRHELFDQSFAGKIFVLPGAKGSSSFSVFCHTVRLNGVQPKAVLYNTTTYKMALGAVVMHVPSMTDFDIDPLTVIRTGDWVKVDADNGVVEITKAD